MARTPQQRPIAHVVAVLAPNLAHKVQDREDPLPVGPPQPSSQLLEEHRGALGRSKHEHGVDLRQVDTLVEKIDGEDGAKLSSAQSRERCTPIIARSAGIERHRRVAETGELARHEVGMTDARAKSQGPHLVRVRHEFLDSLVDSNGSKVIAGEHVVELARDISSALETYRGEIRCVIHPEIVKRTEQSLVECIPKPGLRGRCGRRTNRALTGRQRARA